MNAKKKILIIDDDPDICRLLTRYLSSKGYDVAEMFSGKKALDYLSKTSRDLVLCDFRLPDMDGLEVLQQIRKISPPTKVIMITAYSEVKTAVSCIKLGAHDYVTKPIHHEEILHTINDALHKQTAGSSNGNETHSKAGRVNFEYIHGPSEESKKLDKVVELVAPTDMTVIIEGESGTGKEFVANAIHNHSKRGKKPFVAIDCGALPKEIAGSELFGHKKGSFTGAIGDKTGHFEYADGGTLFLDEIANLTYENQINLLRVLQERKIKRIGDNKDIEIDVRIIVASNEDLGEAVKNGKFREDLFYRLNEFNVDIPPLRRRKKDIMTFANHFLESANRELGKNIRGFSENVIHKMIGYYWHGNLRELKNVIKRAVLMSQGELIDLDCLPREIISPAMEEVHVDYDDGGNLKLVAEKAEREAIMSVLEQTGNNKTKAADILNIDRKTLYNKMKTYNINLR